VDRAVARPASWEWIRVVASPRRRHRNAKNRANQQKSCIVTPAMQFF
jgi:hypothetical protein